MPPSAGGACSSLSTAASSQLRMAQQTSWNEILVHGLVAHVLSSSDQLYTACRVTAAGYPKRYRQTKKGTGMRSVQELIPAHLRLRMGCRRDGRKMRCDCAMKGGTCVTVPKPHPPRTCMPAARAPRCRTGSQTAPPRPCRQRRRCAPTPALTTATRHSLFAPMSHLCRGISSNAPLELENPFKARPSCSQHAPQASCDASEQSILGAEEGRQVNPATACGLLSWSLFNSGWAVRLPGRDIA